MKRILWLLVLVIAFAVPGFAADSGPAPDFTLKGIDGNELTLSSLKGKVVIIDFWATWCPPCREEIPGFVELYKKYKDQGLEIIGISVDKDENKLKKFVADNGVNYPILTFTKDVTEAYGGIQGIQSIPTTFILDHQLNIVGKHVGFVETAAFEKEIEPLLKAAAPAPAAEPAPAIDPAPAAAAVTTSDPVAPTDVIAEPESPAAATKATPVAAPEPVSAPETVPAPASETAPNP